MTILFTNEEKNYLAHYGVLGMKWGIRRYQNPDGSLTPLGQKRYAEYGNNGVIKGSNKDSVRFAMATKRVAEAARKQTMASEVQRIKDPDGTVHDLAIIKNGQKLKKEYEEAEKAWFKVQKELKTKYSKVQHMDFDEVPDKETGKFKTVVAARLEDKYGNVFMTEIESGPWGNPDMWILSMRQNNPDLWAQVTGK